MSSQMIRSCLKLGAVSRSASASLPRPNIVFCLNNGGGGLKLSNGGFAVQLQQPAVFISTSKSKKDVTITADHDQVKSRFEEATVLKDKKNWVSYGYSWISPDEDENWKNALMFATVTICLVGMSFQMAYWPDCKMKDWSQREAYIELARREALGLPKISPDLVPPHAINLPSDEELGNFEIII